MRLGWLRGLLGGREAGREETGPDDEPAPDPEEILRTVERFLDEFGLDAEDVRLAYESMLDLDLEPGRSTRQYIVENDEYDRLEDDLAVLDEPLGFGILHALLRWSPRGVFTDYAFMEATVEHQATEALSEYGYDLTITRADGGDLEYVEDPSTTLALTLSEGDRTVAETTFEYPDDDFGKGNLAALVRAVNRELLAGADLAFRQLDSTGDSWAFILLGDDTYHDLVERHGDPVTAFGRTLMLTEVTADVQYP